MAPGCPKVLEVIPGGESGIPGSPNGTDQLFLWLVNAYKPLPICQADVDATTVQTVGYVCGDGTRGPGEQCDDGNANNGDGCNQNCVISPVITCLSPSVSAGAEVCSAKDLKFFSCRRAIGQSPRASAFCR